MEEERTYLCIDMKSFYASVECAERNLNPFETNLVVADVTRGKNALCLAVSPKLKSFGVGGRARLSEIPKDLEYIAAPPRMKLYVDYAADIYAIYLNYFSPDDIHVYSIDESFIDVTPYLKAMKTDGVKLATMLMDEIAAKLHIPSTAGVGTNLYLSKIALDITAKHSKEHIGYLNEELYKKTLWDHRPITDFWQIAFGTAKRLEKCGIYTMRQLACADEALIYKIFGINAELLLDHANGRESCLIEDIKNYRAKSRSVSFSQILPKDYSPEAAETVMAEMAINACEELMKRKYIAGKVGIGINYSFGTYPTSACNGHLPRATAATSVILPRTLELYRKAVREDGKVRQLFISMSDISDEGCEGFDLFCNTEALEKEKRRDKSVLEIKQKYGKNAVLRGLNFLDGATQKDRNQMIGGHRAGYDDTTGQS